MPSENYHLSAGNAQDETRCASYHPTRPALKEVSHTEEKLILWKPGSSHLVIGAMADSVLLSQRPSVVAVRDKPLSGTLFCCLSLVLLLLLIFKVIISRSGGVAIVSAVNSGLGTL